MDLYGQTWQPFHLKPTCLGDFWTEALGGGTCLAEPWKKSGDTTETCDDRLSLEHISAIHSNRSTS